MASDATCTSGVPLLHVSNVSLLPELALGTRMGHVLKCRLVDGY